MLQVRVELEGAGMTPQKRFRVLLQGVAELHYISHILYYVCDEIYHYLSL